MRRCDRARVLIRLVGGVLDRPIVQPVDRSISSIYVCVYIRRIRRTKSNTRKRKGNEVSAELPADPPCVDELDSSEVCWEVVLVQKNRPRQLAIQQLWVVFRREDQRGRVISSGSRVEELQPVLEFRAGGERLTEEACREAASEQPLA